MAHYKFFSNPSVKPPELVLSTEFTDQATFYKYMDENFNVSGLGGSNGTASAPAAASERLIKTVTFVYSMIFLVGLLGNVLVVFSVLRNSKMQTATNTYILNLALADTLFLFALVFFIPSYFLQRWPFDTGCCVLFFGLTAINWYASVFTLTAMSIDRYMAIVKMVSSSRRSLIHSRAVCAAIWLLAIIVMFPTLLFSKAGADPQDPADQNTNCRIKFPSFGLDINPDLLFIFYSFSIGFALPMALTSFFYVSVLVQLRRLTRRQHSSKRLRRSNRKATVLVLCIIFVYTACWLPFWSFQIILVLGYELPSSLSSVLGVLIQVLTYVNATCNPILYAFLSENFRTSFLNLILCGRKKDVNVNGTLLQDHTLPPSRSRPADELEQQRLTVALAVSVDPEHTDVVCLKTLTLRKLSSGSLSCASTSLRTFIEPRDADADADPDNNRASLQDLSHEM